MSFMKFSFQSWKQSSISIKRGARDRVRPRTKGGIAPNVAASSSSPLLRHVAQGLPANKPNRWAQSDMTTLTMGSATSDTHERSPLKRSASWCTHATQQLLKFIAHHGLELIRRGADKMFGIEACAESNHISGWWKFFFKLLRHGVYLSANHVARHGVFGPPFWGERAHFHHTINEQGRGFFKPRPWRCFCRRLPLMQHKMRCPCNRTCRHDSLKF